MKNIALPTHSDKSVNVIDLIAKLKNQEIQSSDIFDLLKGEKLSGADFLKILSMANEEIMKGSIKEPGMTEMLRKSLEIQAAARGIEY